MFSGSITALVTPFQKGEVDWKSLDDLIEFQIDQGSHGLVICGTTAESPTMSHDEHKAIVKRAVDVVKGRVPVIAGTGSNSTREALELTAEAHNDGADAALIVTPYYNKPTQEGLYEHFRTLATDVNIPILIYNIPGRCVIDMTVDTMARLSQFSNIIGVKDATGDLERVQQTKKAIGPGFCQLTGEDANTYEFLKLGGHGAVSVSSNVAPSQCAALHNSWNAGDKNEALIQHNELMVLHKALFCESSPQPVKYALFRMGLCSDEMRLPLVRASRECRTIVDDALSKLDLIIGNENQSARA